MIAKLFHLVATLMLSLILTLGLVGLLKEPALPVYAADSKLVCNNLERLHQAAQIDNRLSLDEADLAHCTPTGRPSVDGRDPRNLQAEVMTMTFIINASKDNTLYEDLSGALSNGAGQHLFAGKAGSGRIQRGLIAFDLAGQIPAGSTVVSASLKLNMSQTSAGAEIVTLHTLQADWGEGTSDAGRGEGGGATATTGDATWLHTTFDTATWTTPGGDFVATPSATQTVSGLGNYTWSSTPGMVADVQSWLDASNTNFGWLLKGNETGSRTSKRFDSKDHPTPANRPILMVTAQVSITSPVTTTIYLPALLR